MGKKKLLLLPELPENLRQRFSLCPSAPPLPTVPNSPCASTKGEPKKPTVATSLQLSPGPQHRAKLQSCSFFLYRRDRPTTWQRPGKETALSAETHRKMPGCGAAAGNGPGCSPRPPPCPPAAKLRGGTRHRQRRGVMETLLRVPVPRVIPPRSPSSRRRARGAPPVCPCRCGAAGAPCPGGTHGSRCSDDPARPAGCPGDAAGLGGAPETGRGQVRGSSSGRGGMGTVPAAAASSVTRNNPAAEPCGSCPRHGTARYGSPLSPRG